jgi:PEP-CTERM motif
MRFRRVFAATCVAASLSVSALSKTASATGVLFDSLDSAASSAAYAGGIDPVMSATFSTGAASVRVSVALSLFNGFLGEGGESATYTVSLDGGIPLSDLSFDPIAGLNYLNGFSVDFQGPVIKSVTLPVASLGSVPQIERFNQFASVQLESNSLYWIEVRVDGDAVVEWGITADVSGPGVANNYLAWDYTDDGFFLNKGVDPFPFDNALQMKIDAVPEPSTWVTMLIGFAGLGFAGYRSRPKAGLRPPHHPIEVQRAGLQLETATPSPRLPNAGRI